MTNDDKSTIRARYRDALKKYGEVQSDLATALKGMHGIGEYPPPPPRLRFPLDRERVGKTRKMQIGFGPDKLKHSSLECLWRSCLVSAATPDLSRQASHPVRTYRLLVVFWIT